MPVSATSACSPEAAGARGGMRSFLRLLAGMLAVLVLALALWPAAREAASLAQGAHRFIPLGQLWFELDRASLNMAQAGIQRYVAPWLWEDVVQRLLVLPAWPVLGGLGLLLLLLRPRAR